MAPASRLMTFSGSAKADENTCRTARTLEGRKEGSKRVGNKCRKAQQYDEEKISLKYPLTASKWIEKHFECNNMKTMNEFGVL